MKNKKIILLFILVLLISIFGVSFALYNYNKTSKNSKLIVGDIYMHYKESDMSILTTAEDTSRFYYNGYLLNPNMKNQEYQELDTRNELSKCVDYISSTSMPLNSGDTYIAYCQGTGKTSQGKTFQENLNEGNWFPDEMLTKLKNLNVVTSDNKINSIMASQTYEEKQEVIDTRNELSKCADYFINSDILLFGVISFCKNETIELDGITIQFQSLINDNSTETQINELKKLNVVLEDNTVNPIMSSQEYVDTDTRNELSKCIEVISILGWLDDNSMVENYCKGTGKNNEGKTMQDELNELQSAGYNVNEYLEARNIIFSKKGILSSYSTDKHTPNPEMKNQTYSADNRNELSKCVDYFKTLNSGPVPQSFIPTNKSNLFQITAGVLKIDNSYNVDDATIIAYCQGTGTIDGNTFQSAIDNSNLNINMLNELKDKNIVTSDNKVNPIMASQTYTENGQNELSRCVDYFVKIESAAPSNYKYNNYSVKQIDTSNTELTTRMINFCQGTGTFDGSDDSFNFQTAISDNYFSSDTYLYDNNIIVYETKTLPYFEFTIDEKNTSNKDINYNIKLAHGDVIENKTENNRLMDKYLIFKLVEVINNEEVELVDNIKYDNINNNIIYKNIISKNTNEEINHTYRLYMIVDPNLMIGNLEGAVYSFEEYANLFASIKVNVDGNYE